MKQCKWFILLLCLALSAFLLTGCQSGQPAEPTNADRFQAAVDLVQAGRYDEAAQAFDALGHYPDAPQYALYSRALASAENGNWAQACSTFKTLGSFLDSPILTDYALGRALESTEDYENALNAYAGLEQYGDVSARISALPGLILARDYRAAAALEEQDDLAGAESAFLALGSYQDSAARAAAIRARIDERAAAQAQAKLEADYQAALASEASDEIVAAHAAFVALGDYRDSAEHASSLAQEAEYRSAFLEAENGNYLSAQRIYAGLGDYKDAPEKARVLLAFLKADSTGAALDSGIYSYRIGDLYGFVDLNENRDLQPQWNSLGSFDVNGFAIASSGTTRLINRRGQAVSEGFSGIRRLNSRLYLTSDSRSRNSYRYSLLDREGHALAGTWYAVDSFSEGFSLVQDLNGRWGFIDENGTVAIAPEYTAARAFSEGYAAVQKDGLWGYIGSDGSWKLEPAYSEAMSFSHGLAAVRTSGGDLSVIDPEGTLILYKESVYQRAEQLAGSGSYEEAVTEFESLGSYADSHERALKARDQVNLQIYARAEECLQTGRLEDAAETFEWLGDYSDAAERAETVRETIRANAYAHAQVLENAGQLDLAILEYQALGDYQGSAAHAGELLDIMNQGILEEVNALAEQGKSMEAFNLLLPIADWKEVPQRIVEIYTGYLQQGLDDADALMEEGRYEEAIARYGTVASERASMEKQIAQLRTSPDLQEDYQRLSRAIGLFEATDTGKDTDERIAVAQQMILARDYAAAEEQESRQQYAQAAELFARLGDYNDSADRAISALKTQKQYEQAYADAEKLEAALQFEGAIAAFEALGAFSDAKDRAENAKDLLVMYRQSYADAEAMECRQQYAQAAELFARLGDYNDSADRVISALKTQKQYEQAYADAEKLEAALQFEDAIAAYEALGAFGDAKDRAENAKGLLAMYRQSYTDAEAMERRQQYAQAAELFTLLGAYSDSAGRAEAASETQKQYEQAYADAEKLEAALQFEDAIAAFEALGSFSDAADRAEAAGNTLAACRQRYAEAEALAEKGEYDQAYAAFVSLGKYADSAERAVQMESQAQEQRNQRAYASAEALEENGRYEQAITAFEALGDYGDAADRIPPLREKIRARDYAAAQEAIGKEDYEKALQLLSALDGYEDSETLLAQAQTGLKYQQALRQALSGDISGAYAAFTQLENYRDSATKAGILSNLSHSTRTQEIVPGVLIYEFHELWGLANLNTNVSVPAKYTSIAYEDGTRYRQLDLLLVYIQNASEEKCTCGYIDFDGKEVVPCRYWKVSDFDEEGRCTVTEAQRIPYNSYSSYCRLYFGIMTQDGSTITPAQWRVLGSSSNAASGYFSWNEASSNSGWYISGYKVTVPAFVNGSIKVQDTDKGFWGYIDENGSILGDGIIWSEIGDFSDGMAMVKANGKYGFIDEQGVQVGQVRWDTVRPFSFGYAAVKENGLWGFIDHSNTLIIPCRYAEVNDFKEDGTCDVKTADGTWDIIDTAGVSQLFGN